MFITVFTATYNRAYLLPRLYDSICAQTDRDFEWIVVDDGSTDGTAELIRTFAEEKKIAIRYYYQQNRGKHIALNKGLLHAKGEYFLSIDSDDFLSENCLEICRQLATESAERNIYGGFTFIHASERQKTDAESFGHKRWIEYNSYEWPFQGEMLHVFSTKIASSYPFPEFEGENFCQESVQIIPIVNKHRILYSDHILAFGDYLDDGLSQNLYARLLKNPRYAMLAFKTKLQVAKTVEERKTLAENYWDIAFKTKQPKLNAFLKFPVSLSLPVLTKKALSLSGKRTEK